MNVDDVDSITVLGAGNMGHGIAEVAALAGYDVVLRDIDAAIVEDGYDEIEWSLEKLAEKGRLDEDPDDVAARVATTTDLEAAVSDADLVIEAGPEQLSVKQDIFESVDAAGPRDCSQSNGSSSVIPGFRSDERPDRCGSALLSAGPMDLVEVITQGNDRRRRRRASSSNRSATRRDMSGDVVGCREHVLGTSTSEPAWMVSAGEATIRGRCRDRPRAGLPDGPVRTRRPDRHRHRLPRPDGGREAGPAHRGGASREREPWPQDRRGLLRLRRRGRLGRRP